MKKLILYSIALAVIIMVLTGTGCAYLPPPPPPYAVGYNPYPQYYNPLGNAIFFWGYAGCGYGYGGGCNRNYNSGCNSGGGYGSWNKYYSNSNGAYRNTYYNGGNVTYSGRTAKGVSYQGSFVHGK
jgi:hypothetical protein